MSADSLLLEALRSRTVAASIVDIDHFRIRGGMAVETDYIIQVSSTKEKEKFAPFSVAKTYAAFRTWAQQLKSASHSYTSQSTAAASLPPEAVAAANYCELVFHLIASQKSQYLGQVNFRYVQVLAQQRSLLIDRVLDATVSRFPTEKQLSKAHPLVEMAANLIESFLLTDHCKLPIDTPVTQSNLSLSQSANNEPHPFGWLPFVDKDKAEKKGLAALPPVVPLTRRDRRSPLTRALDEKDLRTVGDQATLLLDDDRSPTELVPSYSRPVPVVRSGGTRIGNVVDNNPFIFALIFVASVALVQHASTVQVRLDGDLALLVVFAAFCLGLHTPRPMVGGFDRPPSMKGTVKEPVDYSGRQLLRRSMTTASNSALSGRVADLAHGDNTEMDCLMGSPMAIFPVGAPLGSITNCWGESDPSDFRIRGPDYLQDRKKIPSDEFLFPIRGVDLFLTDTCPENVGSHPAMFAGDLRRVPTFIINFRLPWAVLVFYFEIPAMYIPFVRACYEPDFDESQLPSLNDMTPGQRATCRFLHSDMAAKNKTLKIIPVVVKGPWVVRQVVGGKPALIGNKVPIDYAYEPGNEKEAMYLEADLDIAASSAARGILSVARTYTHVLTLDLGFVVQSNAQDELPECMMVGCRLHGVDPLQSPPFPATDNVFVDQGGHSSDDGSVTPMSPSHD